jgi:hypothetical protein
MDWARAIERNRDALTAIVASLFAMNDIATATRIPHTLHRAVLRILMPAEAAVRRLIVIAARGLVVTLPPSRPAPQGPVKRGSSSGRASFRLTDRRKHFDLKPRRSGPRVVPRIHVYPYDTLVPQPKAPGSSDIDATRLCRRLQAIKLALDDLPRQARRLARWRRRREKLPGPKFTSPLRPGPAPGKRKKPAHEVDHVLADCHWLAWEAMRLDTS